jgi:hypothetical protein
MVRSLPSTLALSGEKNKSRTESFSSRQLKLAVKAERNWTEPLGSAEVTMMTMTVRLPPTHWSPTTISTDEACERLDRALEELEMEDQWINSFIKRLNQTIEEIGQRN